jgi:hypothetical protein
VDSERDRYQQLATKAIISHETYADTNARAIAGLLRDEAARRARGQANLPGATQMPGGAVPPAAPTLLSDSAVIPAEDLYAIGGAYAQCDALIDWARGLGGE